MTAKPLYKGIPTDLTREVASLTLAISHKVVRYLKKQGDLDNDEILDKVFKIDVTGCDSCGGDLGAVCSVQERFSVERYLKHVGIDHVPPARAPISYKLSIQLLRRANARPMPDMIINPPAVRRND